MMDQALGGRVYLDSNAIIYTIERVEPYAALLQPLWDAADQRSVQLVTSQLSVLECLVHPIRKGNDGLVRAYRRVLYRFRGLVLSSLEPEALEMAARLRAAVGSLKTPDAIHAASSIREECSSFVTNDERFQPVPGLHVVYLSGHAGEAMT